MRGLFDQSIWKDTFLNSIRPPDADPVIGKAVAIVKFLILAEQAGEISPEQSNRFATQVYNALRGSGYNLPLLPSEVHALAERLSQSLE